MFACAGAGSADRAGRLTKYIAWRTGDEVVRLSGLLNWGPGDEFRRVSGRGVESELGSIAGLFSGVELLLSGTDGLVSPAGRWSWNVFGCPCPYSEEGAGLAVGAEGAGTDGGT